MRWWFLTWLLVAGVMFAPPRAATASDDGVGGVFFRFTDELEPAADDLESSNLRVIPATLLQDPAPLTPPIELQPVTPLPEAAAELSVWFLQGYGVSQSLLSQQRRSRAARPGSNVVFGAESRSRVTTDTGNLLHKSPSSLGVGVQRRTPIVSDPRVRGSRVGQLAASGSYWVPARIDLDTPLSKIDSRIVDDVIVIKGPYSALYGPGLYFFDLELLPSPRFDSGPSVRGSTSVDYQHNGGRWYGRQSLWGGGDRWGYRLGYGERTGVDYLTGGGLRMPSGYHSRDWDVALGYDVGTDQQVEVHYLRLDQTDVEYPGYAFDIDFLVTDGFDVVYTHDNPHWCDELRLDAWYNRTRFAGNAQGAGKRQQFPFFDFIRYEGFTDVDSMSTGGRLALSWGDDDHRLTAGADMRVLKQELNEISSGRIGFTIFRDANSPVPKSRTVDPGLFVEKAAPVTERFSLRAGARVDFVNSNVIDDPVKLEELGIAQPQSSLADILGTDQFHRNHTPWGAYVTGSYEWNECWTVNLGAGHARRPPSLTELYAAQPFMFLLQNGQNNVTGDPRLKEEKLSQIDLGVSCDFRRFRGSIGGFYAMVEDYITFENTGVFRGPPFGQVEQISIRYVNTDLATLIGVEGFAEYDIKSWVSAFATLNYVEGRDTTRNGKFATQGNSPGNPSQRVPGLPRGFFSGVGGAAVEPLPGIWPLESRLGIRLHSADDNPRWSVEFAARAVAGQDRVATSLLETPTGGFTTFDIRGICQPCDGLLLVAGVENLADRNYREHLDFRSENGNAVYQPGVSFYFGSELTY